MESPDATAQFCGIRISWRSEDNRVCVRIEDNGEGIAPEDLPHIFEPFYRGDRSRSRRRGGTGLGIALVRSIVEAHGGNISVESQLSGGAVFASRRRLQGRKPFRRYLMQKILKIPDESQFDWHIACHRGLKR